MNQPIERHAAELQARSIWSRISDHIIKVQVPLPFSLKWVNSYLLLHDQNNFTVIDPGLHTGEATEVWNYVLEQLQLCWKQCASIVVTHQHPDHYGLAGYVQERSGAPVYMTRESKAYTDKLWGDGREQYEGQMLKLLHRHSTPAHIMESIILNLRTFQERVEPQPTVTWISAGEEIQLGNEVWDIIHTEGHAYGGIMLYTKQKKILICGDQVLPRITPHVGVVPGENRPVLAQFLNNLLQISQLDVELALPGHREVFSEYRERIESIISHHTRRLEKIAQFVSDMGTVNAFQCCESLFGKHLREDPHSMRFALTEVIAHLDYLVQQGKLIEVEDDHARCQYMISR